jgi:hypothetical protein
MPVAASSPASDAAAPGGILPAPPPAAPGNAPAGNFDQVLSGTQAAAAPAPVVAATSSPPAPASTGASGPAPEAPPLPFHARLRSGHPALASASSDPSAFRGKDSKRALPADPAGVAAAPLTVVVPAPAPLPDPAAALAAAPVAGELAAAEGDAADGAASGADAGLPSAGPPAGAPPALGAAPSLASGSADANAPASAITTATAALPEAGMPPPAPPVAGSASRPARLRAEVRDPARPAPADAAAPAATSAAVTSVRTPPASLPPGPCGAKIAAESNDPSGPGNTSGHGGEKHSLAAGLQKDANASSPLGIAAAQLGSAMPAAPSETAVLARALAPEAAVSPAASSSASNSAPAPAAAPAADASAPVRATVETVVRLVEAQASRGLQTVSSVNLNFQVGADDLAVRVEWRNGEVHTQFRTDSEDLRSALASQWQAVSPGLADRSVHFAPPVFGSSTATGGQSLASAGGESAPRQQSQTPAGQGGAQRFSPASSPRPDTSSSLPAAAPALRVAPGRLQTFA